MNISEPAQPAAEPQEAPPSPRLANHWTRIGAIFDDLAAVGRVTKPEYTWSLLHAAAVARHLGLSRIVAIEFGVAGGNGLLALERAALAVEEKQGVYVDVVGFDTGAGLPTPADFKDAPYIMSQGDFKMDESRLREKLTRASLRLGLVSQTVSEFLDQKSAPIGFISFDLDFFSSTRDALTIFDASPERFLPRVLCYFDDVIGYPWGSSNGEWRAIREFNAAHELRVVDHLVGMGHQLPPSEFHSRWAGALFLAHILDHPRYSEHEGTSVVRTLDLD